MTPARLEELRQLAGAIDGPKSGWMDELIGEVDRLTSAILNDVRVERLQKDNADRARFIDDLKRELRDAIEAARAIGSSLFDVTVERDNLRKQREDCAAQALHNFQVAEEYRKKFEAMAAERDDVRKMLEDANQREQAQLVIVGEMRRRWPLVLEQLFERPVPMCKLDGAAFVKGEFKEIKLDPLEDIMPPVGGGGA